MPTFIKPILRVGITLLIVLAAGILISTLWQTYVRSPWTRDGRVSADVVQIAPEVSGTIAEVAVKDNQFVRRGDVLYRLDPKRFALAVQSANADLEGRRAEASVKSAIARRRTALGGDIIATETIDQAKTLFLVSSKSGGTIEPNVLYRHFRALVDDALGKDRAGMCFVAITDPGTPLERLARSEGFRRVFLNPSDIGGRYSVLSYFGLAPAALIGLNIAELINRAERMRTVCAAGVPAHENPAACLGAAMGALAQHGRDKLTLVTSPAIASFSLWAEQIIAEGKEAGERVRQDIEEKARSEGQALIERARESIEREQDLALEALRKESVDLALAAAAKLMHESLDDARDRELVMDYIDDLSERGGGAQA